MKISYKKLHPINEYSELAASKISGYPALQ
jgi:hypothetical protein